MITLVIAFYVIVVVFAIMGSLRGWSREVLVGFSVVLALAIISLFENLLPFTQDFIKDGSTTQFWFRTAVLLGLVFFGYQTPRMTNLANLLEKRGGVQDFILGILFGAISGYLIFGSLWYFMDYAGYPFSPYITSPSTDPVTAQAAENLISIFPPALLTGYWVYVAVVVSFIFVIIVFI